MHSVEKKQLQTTAKNSKIFLYIFLFAALSFFIQKLLKSQASELLPFTVLEITSPFVGNAVQAESKCFLVPRKGGVCV